MGKESEGGGSKAIEVLFENDDVMVINKPSGLLVHRALTLEKRDGVQDTVADWFLARVPSVAEVGETEQAEDGSPILRGGIVHRLDRETSGVMILAKHQDAFVHLKAQFHDRLAQKEYRAFVYGNLKEKWGTINRPIGRSSKDFRLRSAERGAKGNLRSAVTDWELLAQNEKYAYVRLLPKTGRTHQLRVHLKAIGRPIVGDQLYASPAFLKADDLGISRLALHAYKLTIVLPGGREQEFTAELPLEFERAYQSIAG